MTNDQLPRPSDEAIAEAAQCWCDRSTSHIEMNMDLALVFATKLDAIKATIAERDSRIAELEKQKSNLLTDILSIKDECRKETWNDIEPFIDAVARRYICIGCWEASGFRFTANCGQSYCPLPQPPEET